MEANRSGFISRLLGHALLIINILAIVWLGLCYAASVASPNEVNYIALFGLTTPLAIIANAILVVIWLFSRKKLRCLLSLIALILSYPLIISIFGTNYFGDNNMAAGPNTIKIMTWNAHGMGIFNRPHSKEFDERVLEFIEVTDADIICLPEYHTPKSNALKPFGSKIVKLGGYKEFRFQPDNTLGTTIYLGTAIFSRYPLKNYEVHELGNNIYLLQGDIKVHGQTIRMFFVHLNTFGLSDDEKAYIEEIKRSGGQIANELGHSRSFLGKFNYAYKRRAREADKAKAIIDKSPHPVLICGDFNDLPASYTYTTMKGDLDDAFMSKGKGFGRTYNQLFPTIRIDHVFYDPTIMEVIGYQSPFSSLSDHNPVIVNFEIIANPAR